MAEGKPLEVQPSAWLMLYQAALGASPEALLSSIQAASLTMSQRLRELSGGEGRERSDILSSLGDLHVLRLSAERSRLLRQS